MGRTGITKINKNHGNAETFAQTQKVYRIYKRNVKGYMINENYKKLKQSWP